jgi:hypothetical protein
MSLLVRPILRNAANAFAALGLLQAARQSENGAPSGLIFLAQSAETRKRRISRAALRWAILG